MALRRPAEHGAWGILLVSFVSAAAVANVPTLREIVPILLAGVCSLGLFLLRGSVEAQPRGSGRVRALLQPPHLALAGAAGIAAGLLIFFYKRYQLTLVGLAVAALYLLQVWLGNSHRENQAEKRSLAAELLGVMLLCLAAPGVWIAARGRLDSTGVQVWLLNLLFFLGGVLYVKYRVRGLLAHRPFGSVSERLAFAWPVFAYHLLLAAFLGCWILLESRSAALVLAFAPGILRACGLLYQLGRRFPIRRLGWTEIIHSLVFAALLILAFRVPA